MKKFLSVVLVVVTIITLFIVPAAANTETISLKVKGTTVKSLNKTALNEVNELRLERGYDKLKMDSSLVKSAYKRAAMLAIDYTKTSPSPETAEMPKSFVVAKGDVGDFSDSVERTMYIQDEDIISCGIANLTVGKETFWVIFFGESFEKKYTDYSKSPTSYSSTSDYYLTSLNGEKNYGEFKNKTVRYKKGKKVSGRLTLKNGIAIKNSSKNFPIIYSSDKPDVATVDSNGKVTVKKPSAFKAKSRYTPKKGDFVLFHWYPNDGWLANHVGIVYRVTAKTITTIEGNTGSNNLKTSKVNKRTYSRKSGSIVGYIDNTMTLGSSKAKSLANLAKTQLGKTGKNYYNHTKAWKNFLGGKYAADNWCAIFCGWILEQKGVDPAAVSWSPSCTAWIRNCNAAATAKITATIAGTDKEYSYNFSITV